MSKLYETVHAVLSHGPRSTEEIVTECRRAGLPSGLKRSDCFSIYPTKRWNARAHGAAKGAKT